MAVEALFSVLPSTNSVFHSGKICPLYKQILITCSRASFSLSSYSKKMRWREGCVSQNKQDVKFINIFSLWRGRDLDVGSAVRIAFDLWVTPNATCSSLQIEVISEQLSCRLFSHTTSSQKHLSVGVLKLF